MKKYILIGIIVAAFFGAVYLTFLFACEDDWCFLYDWQKANATSSFVECVERGFPVMESYPRQCRAGDRRFVEDLNTNAALNTSRATTPDCKITGCSSQLCVSSSVADNLATTCEFKAEYACYRSARCEKQATGQCGWTENETLRSCLGAAQEDTASGQ